MTVRRWLLLLLGALLAVDIYFAATLPATSAEGAVYSRYISRPLLDTWTIPFDTRIGLPYALLARVVKSAIGVSELALRLPAVFGGLLFGLALIRMAAGWQTAALVVVFLIFGPLRVFSTAGGTGLALGLVATLLSLKQKNLPGKGVLLGLAIASAPTWFLLATVSLISAHCAGQRKVWFIVDEFLLPAFLTAALFLSPMILAFEKLKPAATDDKSTRVLLRKVPRGKVLTLSVSDALEPGATFYRRRLHLNWIVPSKTAGPDGESDYYLLLKQDEGLIGKRGLKVLQSEGGEILASRT